MAQYVAGVDIGAHSVKLVLGRLRMRRIEVVDRRQALIARDESGGARADALGEALAEVLRDLPRVQATYAAVPGDSVLVRTVQIPKVPARRSEAIIRREIEDDIPFDLDSVVLDHVDAPIPGKPLLRCLVAVARTEVIGAALSILESARLDPAELGVGASVYGSLVRVVPALAGSDPVAIVDIGSRRTEVAIFEAGATVSMRTISAGGDDLTKAIVERYRCTFEKAEEYKKAATWADYSKFVAPALERILAQVRQALSAHAARTGRRVQGILLCGGTSLLDGLAEALSQSTGLRVEHLASMVAGAAGDVTPFQRAEALALRTVAAAGERVFDMRRGPFVYQGQARATRRRLIRAVAAALVLVVGWSFYSLARLTSLEARETKQRERLAVLTERYLGEEVNDFDTAEKMMESARPVKSPMPKADAFGFLSELSRLIPEEVVHDIEELEIKPGKVQIKGIVDTIASRDEIISRLAEYTECVEEISKGKTTQSPKDNRQKYTLDLQTECP